jgi:hypothetical protein
VAQKCAKASSSKSLPVAPRVFAVTDLRQRACSRKSTDRSRIDGDHDEGFAADGQAFGPQIGNLNGCGAKARGKKLEKSPGGIFLGNLD